DVYIQKKKQMETQEHETEDNKLLTKIGCYFVAFGFKQEKGINVEVLEPSPNPNKRKQIPHISPKYDVITTTTSMTQFSSNQVMYIIQI
ncbi:hypothetical protein ACJX0J_030355, partial [Zea mays]